MIKYRKNFDFSVTSLEDRYFIHGRQEDFEVNEVAAYIYDLCDGKKNSADIAKKIATIFGVSKNDIIDDVEQCLTDYVSQNIILIMDESV